MTIWRQQGNSPLGSAHEWGLGDGAIERQVLKIK